MDNCTFNLSSYVGQSVKIRFALLRPCILYKRSSCMYGMMVDDISFGGYTNNGVNDGQMTWSLFLKVEISGIWELMQRSISFPLYDLPNMLVLIISI